MPALLSINNYFYLRGGAESVFFEEMALFSREGWDVVPFSMHDERNQASPWSQYFIDSLEFDAIDSTLAKAKAVPKIIYSFESRRKLRELLAQFRPDIVHAHNIYHHLSPSILPVLKEAGLPVVVTLHDLKIACPAYRMLNDQGICEKCKGGKNYHVLTNRCIKGSALGSAVIMAESYLHQWLGSYRKHVDRFIVPSRFYKDKFVEWGWPAEQFAYVPNFVDAEAFTPYGEAGEYFFYFGRLSFEKGVGTLIKAALDSGVKLKIAGTGPDGEALKALAGGAENIEFLGFLRGDPLHEAIGRARAVVLPSEWYENAPISVMESCAMARPVLGADIGGIPELIREGETGFVFPSADVAALSALMTKVAAMSDGTLCEMGQAGRRWMEADFSREAHLAMLKDVYAGVGANVGN
ncbi:glycosyltransferase family 4 protein [Granulosicoccaceae sp. 1_MG-2023]|nr:glycosyltransferase family 4 protein [Granulosicoccaceae sp. 1_MG-2023]